MKTAFIFPAFISDYLGNEPEILNSFSDDINKFTNIASNSISEDFKKFSVMDFNFRNNELYSQISSFIFSCSLSNILKNTKEIIPDYIAGNSMGLYSALYCGESFSFEDGLRLITEAYGFIQKSVVGLDTGMGSITGLDIDDLKKIVNIRGKNVEVVNSNNKHSFLISGEKVEIDSILELARAEGALFTSSLNVKSPYHTKYLKGASEKFYNFIIQNIDIKPSSIKIISSVDQKQIVAENDIINELARNICNPINWYASMYKMLDLKVSRFVECGAGNSLYKASKFIKGDFEIFPINKIDKI